MDEEVSLLTGVESILTSRPLCAASDDPNDCEPLTPNHLLLQRKVNALPPGSFVKNDILSRKRWKQTQNWLIIFGSGGLKKTSHLCRRVRSGRDPFEMQKLVTSCYS